MNYGFNGRALLVLMFGLLTGGSIYAQCTGNTTTGTFCNTRSSFYDAQYDADQGCGSYRVISNYSPGEYFRMPVLSGGCYTVQTCGSGIDTQVMAFQGNNSTGPFSYNDDSGPLCTGDAASINFVPTFTDYTRVDVRQFNCRAGGTASITVRIRQNNNLTVTSTNADMIAGQTRTLTATPAAVTGNLIGSGNAGSFSGTGVTGTTFTAPTPAGASQLYTVTYTFGFCTRTQNIRVFQQPTANAGNDQFVCTDVTTLNATTPTVGSGTWSIVSGPGFLSSPSSPNSGLGGLVTGNSTTLVWTVTNGPGTATDTVVVTRESPPTTPIAGADQTICSTSASLSGNPITNGNGQWVLVSGSGSFSNANSGSTQVNGVGVGNNRYAWTSTNGNSCGVLSDTMTITRIAEPSNVDAGPDQTICSGNTTLAAAVPVGGSGVWAIISGSGNISNPGQNNSPISNLGVGTNTLVWYVANANCPVQTDTVVITREAEPTPADAGPDQTICSDSVQLSATSLTIGTGMWELVSGSGNIGDSLAAQTQVTGLGIGDNIFTWTTTNGSCPPSVDSVIITREQEATIVDAGPDQNVCSDTATLSASTPDFGSGSWSQVAGLSIIASPNSEMTAVGNLSVGDNIFVWTVTNGSCPVQTDTVVITRDPLPSTSNAGADQTVCADSTVLAGNVPVTGMGKWELISGAGSFFDSTDAMTGVVGLGIGNNIFTWTITNGSCPPSVDTIVITRDAQPTIVDAGAAQILCSDSTNLAAMTPDFGSGVWSLASGQGNIANFAQENTSVTGLGVGDNIFVWTVTNGTCPPQSDTVVITQDAEPTTSMAGMDQIACDSFAVLNGNMPTVGTGTWTVIGGSAIIADSANPNSAVSNLSTGLNVFAWTIANGTCPVSSDTVVIERALPVLAPTIQGDSTVCSGDSAFLTSSASNAVNPLWYDAPTGGNVLDSAVTLTIPNLTATTTYWLQVTDTATGCPSTRSAFTVNVNALPMVNIGPDTAVCDGDTICFDAGPGFVSYVWSTGETTQVICPASSSDYIVCVTDSNGCTACDTVNLMVNPLPIVDLGPADTVYCLGTVPLMLGVPDDSTSSYVWNTGDSSSIIMVDSAATYTLTVTNANGCTGSDSIVVSESVAPMALFSVDSTNCPAIRFIFLGNNPGGTFAWDFGDGVGTDTVMEPTYDYTAAGNDTFLVTLITTNVCGSDTLSANVDVDCIVGLEPAAADFSLEVFPNPNDGLFNVKLPEIYQQGELEVFDMTGKRIWGRMLDAGPAGETLPVDLRNYAQGVFVIRLNNGEAIRSTRVIVH